MMAEASSIGSAVDEQDVENWRHGQAGVGMPATLKLEQFGYECWCVFGARAYLVGSALRTRKWRDVDVRVILSDEEYERQVGEFTVPRALNMRWNALCLAFAARGREITGLPIDFQIDQQTAANEKYPEPRSALGLPYLLAWEPEAHNPESIVPETHEEAG